MYGGRGDRTVSDYTIEHDNLPAITRPSLDCLWNRIECHVTSFTGSSHGSRLVSIVLLLVPDGLRIDNPHFIAGARHENTRHAFWRFPCAVAVQCEAMSFVVSSCILSCRDSFVPPPSPLFSSQLLFATRRSHPTRTTHVTQRAPFHPVSLGIHLIPSRRLSHLPSPAFFLPSYQQHLWNSSHRHTLPPTTSPMRSR